MVPLYVLLEGTGGGNQTGSETETRLQCLGSLEQKNSFPERPDSAESSSSSSSSGRSILRKSSSGIKRTKPVKIISGNSQANDVLNNSCELGIDSVASSESVDSLHKLEKPVKKSSRRKKKKKGKKFKKSLKKYGTVTSPTKDGTCDASVSATSISSHSVSPVENISQNMLERIGYPGWPVKDTEENSSAQTSDDCRNNSASRLTCTSYNDEIYNSCRCEKVHDGASSSSTASFEIIRPTSCDISEAHSKENDIYNPSKMVYTSAGTITGVRLKQNRNASSISDDQNSSREPNSYADKLKTDIFENSSDVEKCSDASNELSSKYNSAEGELVMDSTEHNSPFRSINAESCDVSTEMCDVSTEMSIYCSMDSSDLSNSVTDTASSNERLECSSEASSSNDFQPVVYRKRGRFSRRASFDSHSFRRSRTVNLHSWAEEGNDHTVWQWGPKSGTERYIGWSNNNNLVHQHVGVPSKVSEIRERFDKGEGWKQHQTRRFCRSACSPGIDSTGSVSTDVNLDDLPYKTTNGGLLHKFSENPKTTPKSALKQECQGIMDECQSGEIQMSGDFKIHIEEEVEMLLQAADHQQSCSQSNSISSMQVDCGQSESMLSERIHSLEAQNEISSLSTESDLLGRTHVKVHSGSVITGSGGCQSVQLETESMRSDCSLEFPIVNEVLSDKLGSVEIRLELPNPRSNHSQPSTGQLSYLSGDSQEAEFGCSIPPELDELSHRSGFHPLPLEKFSGPAEGEAREAQSLACFDTDLCEIVQAVDESYKLLTASEASCQMIGTPLAEFEKFLHSASPSIDQSISSCKTCSRDQIIGNALCIHQVPDIPLGNLWQWYEKPGSYGLEVKVEDCLNSQRTRNGCSQFHAYFVPYLSAVQLFAQSRSPAYFSNGISNSEAKKNCEKDTTSKSSISLNSLPIFSMLLPQPRKAVPSGKDEVHRQRISNSNFNDGELLFEYFEAEQPQHRRPLPEM